jgi:hypothetical protein
VAVSAPQPGAPASEAGDVVLDAAVRVQVEPLDGAGETLTAQASRQDSANKLLYEADMELPSAGQWHVEIQVQGPAGAGVAGFDLHILPAAQSPLAVPGWLPWAGLGLVVGAVAWSIYGFRTRDDRRPMTDDRSHSPLYSLPYAVQPAAARQGTPVGKPPGRQPVEESIHG